jgi:HdeA/HdeB family
VQIRQWRLNMRKPRRRHPVLTRHHRRRHLVLRLRQRLSAALRVAPRSAPSAALSAAMRVREPRSGLRSVALHQLPAEVPPVLQVHVIDKEHSMKPVSIAIAILCIAAFGGQLAAQQPAPSDAKVASTKWEVERVRCSDLLAASDDDRASAAMFYFGYLAAKDGIHIVDVGKIEDNISRVMKQCSATPSMRVPQAFRQALRPEKK